MVVRCDNMVGVLKESSRWTEQPIQPEETFDPMGAGDAFNAGYIAHCLKEKPVDETLSFAIRCGRAVATSAGDTAGFPRNLWVRV